MVHGWFVFASWLVATTLSSCESSSTTSTPARETAAAVSAVDLFTPVIAGESDFIDLGAQHAVRFYLRGSYTTASDDVKLVLIEASGAPGRHGKKDKLPSLAKIVVTDSSSRDWKVEPSNIGKAMLGYDPNSLGTSKKLQDYTLEIAFNYSHDGGKVDTVTKRWWITTLADPTPALKLPEASSEGGDTISNVSGTGTFYGGQRIAIYDFRVDFTQPADKVEIFTGAQSTPTSKTYTKEFTTPQNDHWEDTGIVGRYDGVSDTYFFKVVVTSGGTSSAMVKRFDNILANQGVTIPISDWVLLP